MESEKLAEKNNTNITINKNPSFSSKSSNTDETLHVESVFKQQSFAQLPLTPKKKNNNVNIKKLQSNKKLNKYKDIVRKFFVSGMKKRVFLK